MSFWQDSGLVQLLIVAALLVAASAWRRLAAPVRRIAMPDSMIAGVLGLALGPSLLGVLPLDTAFLEKLVYHALALVFIAVGLQTPVRGRTTGGARSLAVGIPLLAILQGFLGLLIVLAWNHLSDPLHPGFGLMVPLAFSQGPGQALSLGSAWQEMGMADGAQVGLIMAALGFAWCVLIGVPLTTLARYKGWITPLGEDSADLRPDEGPPRSAPPGGMETLSLQLVSVGSLYLVTFGIIAGATSLLRDKPDIAALLWGFHFIIGGVLSMTYRRGLEASGIRHRLHDGLLGRIAGTTVDLATVAAIAAIRFEVLVTWLVPILVLTSVAGVISLVVILWLARRAFPSHPFEHAIVLFGLSTGTMPTGLALLRILDPDLRGPVATSTVQGATAAIIFGAPLLLVVIPIAVADWPQAYPGTTWVALGIMVVYAALLAVGWRWLGPLRILRPLHHIWPKND